MERFVALLKTYQIRLEESFNQEINAVQHIKKATLL